MNTTTQFDNFVRSFVTRRAFAALFAAIIASFFGGNAEAAKRNRKHNQRDRKVDDDKKKRRNPCKKRRKNGKRRNRPDGTACPGGTCQSGVCTPDTIPDLCIGVNCPECQKCVNGTCVASDEGQACGGCNVCTGGTCSPGSCPNDGETCVEGACSCSQGATCTYRVSDANWQGIHLETDNGTVPYQFVSSPASLGSGSLAVGPIDGAPGQNKFVIRLPAGMATEDFVKAAIDFSIDASSPGGENDKQHIYMNAYVDQIDNGIDFFGSDPTTSGFYDCRYAMVAQVGSVGGFNTLSFEDSTSPGGGWALTANRTGTCPNSINGFTPGSVLFRISVNVGDSSASDAGVKVHLDKGLVETTGGTKVFDF